MFADIIAVFMNDSNIVDSAASAKCVHVFKKANNTWTVSNILGIDFSTCKDISTLRKAVKELVVSLGECRIAAGKQMSGIIYRELDRYGFSIFEIDNAKPEILDGILMDLEEAEQSDSALETATTPVETDSPGVYAFDLIQYQRQFPEKSSKQALKEFLEHTPFYELKLTCSHIPPWLETAYEVDNNDSSDGNIVATVRKKQCGGSGKTCK